MNGEGWAKKAALLALAAVLAVPVAGRETGMGPVLSNWPRCLAGIYDASATEIVAQLELNEDGRFRYGSSHGALDEVAEGSWRVADGSLHLNSDPVTAPQFRLTGDAAASDGALRVDFDLPRGIAPQYFDALLVMSDGSRSLRTFGAEGLRFAYPEGKAPVSVTVLLPTFGIESAPFPVGDGSGRAMRIAFIANDLGKVDFRDTPVARDGGTLVLERAGREIRFAPRGRGCA